MDGEDEEGGAGEATIPVGGAGSNPTPGPSRKREGRLRARHDGFTPEKQRAFLKALKKTACLSDACRGAGISRNTVRRHRDKWPAFDARVEAALAIAAPKLDLIAWQRATEGAEEKVYRDGKLAMTRVKPSDAMLRLLMQGANPKKYGRTGRTPRRALMKQLRKEARAEVAAKLTASPEELNEKLLKLLGILAQREEKKKLAAGYSLGPDGQLVPPGYRMVRDLPGLPPPDKPR